MGRKKKRTARGVTRAHKTKELKINPDLPFVIRVIALIPLVYLNFLRILFIRTKKSSFNISKSASTYNTFLARRLNSTTISMSRKSKKLEKKFRKAYLAKKRETSKIEKSILSKNTIRKNNEILKNILISINRSFRNTSNKVSKYISTLSFLLINSPQKYIRRYKKMNADRKKSEERQNRLIIVDDLSTGRNKLVDHTNVKSIYITFLDKLNKTIKTSFRILFAIILFPFKLIYKIIHAILTFQISFRLFSLKTLTLLILVFAFYIVSVFYLAILKDIPSPEVINQHDSRLTTRLYDRKGNLLYRVYDNEDRTLVELQEIPTQLIQATIAIEDGSFYQHKGLSIKGIARATKKTFLEEDMQGGSTITQQLVKNTLLSPEKTYERKIKEAILSVELERRYTKNEILEMYLNKISYGGTAHGVKAAAKKYFGKELEELSLAEMSYLAGLPAAPTTYSPFSGNPQFGKKRQADVLRRMVEINAISSSEAHDAFQEKLVFNDQTQFIQAPHFVNYVITELEGKYGQQLIAQGGLDIYTSLDLDLQKKLESIVEDQVNALSSNNVNNGAVVVTDPNTGEILAMVGSVDYWDIENDGNVNVTVSPRQPGSSIKPITYALALENGMNPNSKIDDSPVSYSIAGQRAYTPRNYDNRFHGSVSLATALANSYNIPAVKLLNQLGVDNYINFAEKLGITTWNDRSRYGLSLTLGAGEVRMIDMAEAYGSFANLGYKQSVNPILKIYDPLGNVLEENTCVDFLKESPSILTKKTMFESSAMASTNSSSNGYEYEGIKCAKERVMNETTAFQIGQMLSNNKSRTPAFGPNSGLNITERQVAVKTGTTSNLKDNWAIGFTNDYVVVAWIGNNNGDQMKDVVSGYRGASNIWRATFDYIISAKEVEPRLSIPSNMVEVEICPLTNTLACNGCNNVSQYFIKGEEPKKACRTEDVQKILKEIENRKKEQEEKDQKDKEQ